MGGLTLNKAQFDPTKHKPWKIGSHMPLADAPAGGVQPATPVVKHEPEAPKKGAKRLRVNAKGTGTNTGGT